MSLIKVDWDPDRAALRRFSWIALAVFLALGTWAWFGRALLGFDLAPDVAPAVATGLWTLAAWAGLAAAVRPAAIRPLYLVLTAIGLPIGFVVSHGVLVAVYYLVVTPIGLILRAFGHDPMRRRFDRGAESYWVRRETSVPVERYFRQY